jgi:predicted ester cyclase
MTANKDIITEYSNAVWNDHDLLAIDRYFEPDAQIRSPFKTVQGRSAMHEIIEKWLIAFPDLTIKWVEFIAEDDKVVSRWTAQGTHLGGFFDTRPTYKEVEFSGIIIYRLKNSQIVDYWSLVDMHAILSQLEEYGSIEEALES